MAHSFHLRQLMLWGQHAQAFDLYGGFGARDGYAGMEPDPASDRSVVSARAP